MRDQATLNQLKRVFAELNSAYRFLVAAKGHAAEKELVEMLSDAAPFSDLVETNAFGEIRIDAHCRTGVKGVYAAGDITTTPYKQIIIAMGEGA